MEILNRTNAPFGANVWSTIDSTISQFLEKRLNLRSLVDFDSNYDYDTDSISTKNSSEIVNKKNILINVREPIRMVEIKNYFTISKNVIEEIKKAKKDFDDKEFANAANEFSAIENEILLKGLAKANIKGILSNNEIEKIDVKNTKDILITTAKTLGIFNKNFVNGPFKMVVSSSTLAKLYTEFFDRISLKTKIDDILGANSIVVNQDIGDDKILIISQRGGDFEFYSGLDVSVGFEKELEDSLEFFLIETCAFRLINPEASILLNLK